MKESAGVLLYRVRDGQLEVLIVHPSGNYNRRAPWSIPKGEPDPGGDLDATARRELLEETGVEAGELTGLGSATYKSRSKRVHCYAGLAPAGCQPRVSSWEVDRAEFLPIDRAAALLHPDQAVFLHRLQDHLAAGREARIETDNL